MKRIPVLLSVFAAAALAAGAAHADWSPVSFSFIGQYPDSETDVYGLRIGTIAHHRNSATSVTGLQAGAINKTDSLSGFQLGGANFACEDCDGVQIGGFNLAGRLSGVQIGAVNAALSGCRGAQIGVVNVYAGPSSELSALQFGGVNVANDSSAVVLPIVRVAF